MTDSLHIEPTPLGWTAYYDPEGLTGEGNTEMEAVSDLLEKTDERLGEVLKERGDLQRERAGDARLVDHAVQQVGVLHEQLAEAHRSLGEFSRRLAQETEALADYKRLEAIVEGRSEAMSILSEWRRPA
jgi:chromosome segregation ATPase